MKDWFAGLEPMERLLVSGGGVVLLVLLLYLMIWAPIAGNYQALNDGVAEQKKTLAWMKQAAAELKLVQRSGSSTTRGLGGRSLLDRKSVV